jgi:predicted metalloprotease with PDZ domain
MSIFLGEATKETQDSKVGIAFSRESEFGPTPLCVSLVREGGLFADTDIVPGLLVLQVNGIDVTSFTAKEAADLLRTVEAGGVCTVQARGVVANVTKASAESSCGLSLQKQVGGIMITKLVPDGLFSATDLQVGLKVAWINGQKCPASTLESIALLKAAPSALTVVAWDPAWATCEVVQDVAVAEAEPTEAAEMQEEKKEDEAAAVPLAAPSEEAAPAEAEDAEKTVATAPAGEEEGSQAEEDTSIIDKLCGACIS